MSNMAYPQVLMPKLMVKIPIMFRMKPAFTWRNRQSHSNQYSEAKNPISAGLKVLKNNEFGLKVGLLRQWISCKSMFNPFL